MDDSFKMAIRRDGELVEVVKVDLPDNRQQIIDEFNRQHEAEGLVAELA